MYHAAFLRLPWLLFNSYSVVKSLFRTYIRPHLRILITLKRANLIQAKISFIQTVNERVGLILVFCNTMFRIV
jgi:hypothetical protein